MTGTPLLTMILLFVQIFCSIICILHSCIVSFTVISSAHLALQLLKSQLAATPVRPPVLVITFELICEVRGVYTI